MTPEEREAFESQIRDEAEEEKENKEIKVKKKKRVIKKKKSKDLEEKRLVDRKLTYFWSASRNIQICFLYFSL